MQGLTRSVKVAFWLVSVKTADSVHLANREVPLNCRTRSHATWADWVEFNERDVSGMASLEMVEINLSEDFPFESAATVPLQIGAQLQNRKRF